MAPMSPYMQEVRRRVGSRLLEVPSVSVIVRDAGRVLLVRHENGGVWTTPGGAVEPRETPADAAVRETFEECGLLVEPTRILGVYGGPEFVVRYGNGDETSYVMTVFEARRVSGEPRPDGVETHDVAFLGRDEIRAAATPSWLSEVLEDAFANREAAGFRRPAWSPGAARPATSPRR